MKRHYDDCPVVRRASGSTFIRDGWTKNSQNGRYERIVRFSLFPARKDGHSLIFEECSMSPPQALVDPRRRSQLLCRFRNLPIFRILISLRTTNHRHQLEKAPLSRFSSNSGTRAQGQLASRRHQHSDQSIRFQHTQAIRPVASNPFLPERGLLRASRIALLMQRYFDNVELNIKLIS